MDKVRFIFKLLLNLIVGLWLTVPLLFRMSSHSEYIVVQVKPHHLDRYLLNFVRFSGESKTVVIPLNRRLIMQIGSNYFQPHKKYGNLLATCPEIVFRLFPKRSSQIVINDNYWGVNPDLRWPLGVHPFYQSDELKVRRKNGEVIFFGNDSIQYSKCFDEALWGMPNRLTQLEFVQRELREVSVRKVVPLVQYIGSLLEADFFLCLPGVSWPLCHNFFEAISNGAIPILHHNYLKLFPVHIQKVLAPYSYESLGKLKEIIRGLGNDNELADRLVVRESLELWCEQEFGRRDLLELVESSLELSILNSRCTSLLRAQSL